MSERTKCYRLQVADSLYRFIEEEALPGTGIDSDTFWRGFDSIVHEMGPKNRALLAERERLQEELDNWHRLNPGPVKDMSAYKAFLNDIGIWCRFPPTSESIRKISIPKFPHREALNWSFP